MKSLQIMFRFYRDDRIENYGKSKKTVDNELSALRSM